VEKNNTQIDCILLSDDITVMTSSLRKVVGTFRIKFPTKRIFRIFPILRTDGMAPFGTYLWNDPRIYYKSRDIVNWQACVITFTSYRPWAKNHVSIRLQD